MKEKKERRYTVDFEHFENAMLVEVNLGWQLYQRDRHKMSAERRQKITALFKRFVAEMKPDIGAHKDEVQLRLTGGGSALRSIADRDSNFIVGDSLNEIGTRNGS